MTSDSRRMPLTEIELKQFENYAAEIFSRLGMNIGVAGTKDTPRRWLKALIELTTGYDGDPKIGTLFPRECDGCEEGEFEQTVEGPIPFVALCEHHVLPFQGNAWVGYLRRETIIGISKLTRLVRLYARRFTVQERIAQQVVSALMRLTSPYGAAMYLEAYHSCTQSRGVHEVNAKTRTFVVRGVYNTKPHLCDQFMVIAGLHRPIVP